jgi:hypothetical protein
MWRSYQAEMMRMIATSMGAKNLSRYEELIVDPGKAQSMTEEQVLEKRARLLDKLNAG